MGEAQMERTHGERHAARRRRLAALVADGGADAILVTRLVNVRYLTRLDSSNAALLVPAAGPPVLATHGPYAGMAAEAWPELDPQVGRAAAEAVPTRSAASGDRVLDFEAHGLTVERHAGLAEAADVPLRPLGPLVEDLRRVKDEVEIGLLRE